VFPDIAQYLWLIWLAVVVFCVVLELLTTHLLFIMVAAGALVGGLGGWLLGWPFVWQIITAAVISGLLIFTIRPLLWRVLVKGKPIELTNVDALRGMSAKATMAFADGAGQAKLANGETWTARLAPAHEHDAIVPGSRLVVTSIDGATAVVEPERASAPGAVTA
jgi:membrane protein implicated in regulation of membrane protease activity